MFSKEQVLKYLTIVLLPTVSGGLADWLIVHVQILGSMHIGHSQVAAAILNLGVIAATAATTWLAQHHILKGTYAPATSRHVDAGLVGPRL